MTPRLFSAGISFGLLALVSTASAGSDLLLEDYQNGGRFRVNRFDNSFRDSDGRQNTSGDAGTYATVNWAAKWSGLTSIGESVDLDDYKSFQVDVMVPPGQPVEDESNFYFQLLHKAEVGYAYWEYFVPQAIIPADGKWYRVQFPFKRFWPSAGDGAKKPTDFATTTGTVCGMTFDETGDVYKYKTAHFDNITVRREPVDDVVVTPVPGR